MPQPELLAQVVVKQRRWARPAREHALLQSQHEDGVERARACPLVIEDRDSASCGRVGRDPRSFERPDDVLRCDLHATRRKGLQLTQDSLRRAVRAGIRACGLGRGRSLETPRIAHHRREQRTHGHHRLAFGTKRDKSRHGRTA